MKKKTHQQHKVLVLIFLLYLWVALGKLFQIFEFLLFCVYYRCLSVLTSLGEENP